MRKHAEHDGGSWFSFSFLQQWIWWNYGAWGLILKIQQEPGLQIGIGEALDRSQVSFIFRNSEISVNFTVKLARLGGTKHKIIYQQMLRIEFYRTSFFALCLYVCYYFTFEFCCQRTVGLCRNSDPDQAFENSSSLWKYFCTLTSTDTCGIWCTVQGVESRSLPNIDFDDQVLAKNGLGLVLLNSSRLSVRQ